MQFHQNKSDFIRSEGGNATVEFVIIFPFLFSLFLTGVDLGVTMLRQSSLDRSMDMVVRDLRLGNLPEEGAAQELRHRICEKTLMISTCISSLTIELVPVDTSDFGTFSTATTCINSEDEEINPVLAFNPGQGGEAQELMLLRACVVTSHFIAISRYLTSLPINPDGQSILTSHAAFVNEPR